MLDSLTPAQNVVKIVLDELTALLGQTDSGLVLSSRIPNVIMLVGLQLSLIHILSHSARPVLHSR